MTAQHRFGGLATLLLLGCAAAVSQEAPRYVLSIEELRALAAARPAVGTSLAVSYDVFQEAGPAELGSHVSHLFQSVLVDAATGRFSLDRSFEIQDARSSGKPETVMMTFDGETQATFLPDKMLGVVEGDTRVDGLVESGLWGVMLLGEFQPDDPVPSLASLESLLAHGDVREQVEFVGNTACNVVDVFHEGVRLVTVWLDVDRDLLPMRRVVYGRNGNAKSEIVVDAVVFAEEEQCWLPESWRTEMWVHGEVLRKQTTILPETVQISPQFTDDVFRTRFPPGTVVANQVLDLVYRISESGEPGEVLYERVDDEWVPVNSAAPVEDTSRADASEDVRSVESRTPAPEPLFDQLVELAEHARRQADRSPKRVRPDASVAAATHDAQNAPNPPDTVASDSPSSSKPASGKTRELPEKLEAVRVPLVGSTSGEHESRGTSPWGWLLWAVGAALLIGIGYSAGRQRVTARTACLLGFGVLLVCLAAWRALVFTPEAVAKLDVFETGTASTMPVGPCEYVLADDEVVRWLRNPVPSARAELLKKLQLSTRPNVQIISLTVVWDGAPHFRSMERGYSYRPRRLLNVLVDSLGIPPYRLEGIAVAQQIGLPGDWVVRKDADLDRCMSFIEQVVRKSGHPGFHIRSIVKNCETYDLRGVLRKPQQPVQIFHPLSGSSPTPVRSGTPAAFGDALSTAIQRRVTVHATPEDIEMEWQDNSSGYRSFGGDIDDKMVLSTLGEVSTAIGLQCVESRKCLLVWKLELDD